MSYPAFHTPEDQVVYELLTDRLGNRYHYLVPEMARIMIQWGHGGHLKRSRTADDLQHYVAHHSAGGAYLGFEKALNSTWRYHILGPEKWSTGGYGALIDMGGNVYQVAEPLYHMTYNAGPKWNPVTTAACCIGNFEDTWVNGVFRPADIPSPEMLQSLYTVLCTWDDAMGPKTWKLHSELRQTACPGDKLAAHVQRMRESDYGASDPRPAVYP